MFVFSKGKPKTTNLLRDRKVIWGNVSWGKQSTRGKDGERIEKIRPEYDKNNEYGLRFNIWKYNTGKGFSTKDNEAFEHPAIFPEKLVEDHILSWSNKGDLEI